MASNSENSVNAAERSNSVVCVSCDSSNAPGQKFCLSCGEALWFECPECSEDTPVNSGFCGSCGYDLRKIFQESDALFEMTMEQARAKAADLDLNTAIRLLLGAVDSPKIHRKSQKTELLNLVQTYRKQKSEYKADVEERFEKAKLLLKNSSVEQAFEILKDIPAPLRTAEVEELYQTIHFQLGETKRLSKQLEQLIQKKDLIGALPVIKSLLGYKAKDEKLINLAADIVKRVVGVVEKLKQQGKFKEAFSLIKRVSDSGSSTKTKELKDEIEEIVWLTNYVKRVQEVDGALVAALEKMVESVPTEENKKLAAEAKKRLALVKPDKPTSWSPVPKTPVLGAPVSLANHANLIEGFGNLNVDGYRQFCFQVAAGLALQGLGKAVIPINLSLKKTGFLGFGGQKSGKAAWGIDFGQSALKAVKLSIDSQGVIKLEHAERLSYSNLDPMATANEHRSSMLEALLRLKAKYDIKKDEIININLTSGQVLARFLTLPHSDDKAFKAVLEFEIKLQIPFSLQEVVWDSYIFPNPIGDKKLAVVIAARKTDAALVADMFAANGMKLNAVQSEPIAIYNFNRLVAQNTGADSCDAILDIGYTQSTMTFASHKRVWFRTFSIGIDQFAKLLCRKLKINSDQAYEIIKDPAKAEGKIGRALMAFSDTYGDLIAEINRSIQAYESVSKDFPGNIYLVGGGANLHGLTTFLRHDSKVLSVE